MKSIYAYIISAAILSSCSSYDKIWMVNPSYEGTVHYKARVREKPWPWPKEYRVFIFSPKIESIGYDNKKLYNSSDYGAKVDIRELWLIRTDKKTGEKDTMDLKYNITKIDPDLESRLHNRKFIKAHPVRE